MSRNTSYDSPSPQKPRCPICGNIVALSASQCPNCGNCDFYKVNNAPRKKTCSDCNGDGKARWHEDKYGKWHEPGQDYCDYCGGRGYTLIYSVIDKRTNEIRSDHGDLEDFVQAHLRHLGYDIPPVQPIHRGITREPYSLCSLSNFVFDFVVYIIGLCYYGWFIFIWSAILYLVYQVFKLLFS